MNGEFEKRLQQQSPRQIPAGWRAEILQAARAAGRQTSTQPREPSWLSQLLWPCPQAWAGLAAVWLMILGVHFHLQDPRQLAVTRKSLSPSDLRLVLKEQNRLLAELAAPRRPEDSDRPKPPMPPRSERRDQKPTASSRASIWKHRNSLARTLAPPAQHC